MNRIIKTRSGHFRVVYGSGSRKARAIPVGRQADATSAQAGGADPNIHLGPDEGVTLDAPGKDPEVDKAVALLKASGLFLVERIAADNFGEAMRKLAVGKVTDDKNLMIQGFAELTDDILKTVGATATATAPGSAPQYEGLPEAGESAAATVTDYEVETHNSHADAHFLIVACKVLSNLLDLGGIFTKANDAVGNTTASLGRELADEVTAVVRSVDGELPSNPGLSRSLKKSIDYNAARAVKSNKTKKKIKAVTKKLGGGTGKKPTGPGGLPLGATGSPGGTGAGGVPKGSMA